MATVYRLLDVAAQYFDDNGDPYAGGLLFTYTAGSSTKKTTYQDSTGLTAHANPIVLDAGGRLPAPVFGTTGAYKFVLAPSTDTDPPTSAEWTEDGISGINDTADTSVDQWAASGLTPTYVSATSFTLVGDQTTEFHVGRRLKSTNSGGTRYSRITASSYSAPDTTVTVVNDSGSLDAGLSAVSYGLISATNTSIPLLPANVGGACALLETETASASATLDFALDLTNYARHVIHVNNLKPVTDGAEFWGRLSTDGVTYAATAYRWSRHNLTDAATEGLAGSTNDAKFLMANAVGNQDGEQVSGTIEIASVGGMGVRVSWRLSGENAAGSYYMINGMGVYVAAASTHFRLLFSSGNLSAGTARMYAFKV
jgi:hypothetical protein